MPFPLSVTITLRSFLLIVTAMSVRDARACRATFVSAAWTILNTATDAERSNVARVAFVVNRHGVPVSPSNSLACDFKLSIRPSSSRAPARSCPETLLTDRIKLVVVADIELIFSRKGR